MPEKPHWQIDKAHKLPLPDRHPFMVVRSTGRLINGHNGIFRTVFVEFLRDFVIAHDVCGVRLAEQRVHDEESAGQPARREAIAAETGRMSGAQKKQL